MRGGNRNRCESALREPALRTIVDPPFRPAKNLESNAVIREWEGRVVDHAVPLRVFV